MSNHAKDAIRSLKDKNDKFMNLTRELKKNEESLKTRINMVYFLGLSLVFIM